MNAVKKSNGTFVKVTDDAIVNAMKILAKNEGIFAEPAAAASLAGFIKAREEKIIKNQESVTVIITGNGLKDQKTALNAISNWVTLKPELIAVIKHREEQEGDKNNE